MLPQSLERCLNALIASGAKTAVKMSSYSIDVSSGCCSGHDVFGTSARSPLFPHSSRQLAVSAETGFHSAIGRSQSGMLDVGANVLATNVSGNMTVNMNPCTASTVRISDPTQMPSQIIEKPNATSNRNAKTASRTPLRIRQPITRPVSAITTMPIDEWIRLETLRPTSTDDREIGSDLNRSTMPFCRSLVRPIATTAQEKTMVCAMIPGSKNSL